MTEQILPKCPEELEIYGDEPDKLDGIHQGYRFQVLRHDTLGHLCGYVDLPKDHPWAVGPEPGFIYEDPTIDVHGGLTFGPKPQENGTVRVGFDCAHSGDLVPGMLRYQSMGYARTKRDDVYRNMAYVIDECKNLVEQACDAYRKSKK